MTPVPASLPVAIARPKVPAAATVLLLCGAALTVAGGGLLAALRQPQVYLLHLNDRAIQRALPNPDFREVYARFVSDLLEGTFTFNEYTQAQAESFLVRYTEPPAAVALAQIRQKPFSQGAHLRSSLAIRSVGVAVRVGLPVVTVDAVWTWRTDQSQASEPLRLALSVASYPDLMANHYRLVIRSVDPVLP